MTASRFLHEGGQLADRHRGAAVAADDQHRPDAGSRRAHRCRQGVAEGPPADRVLQPARLLEPRVAADPVARHRHVAQHRPAPGPGLGHRVGQRDTVRGARVLAQAAARLRPRQRTPRRPRRPGRAAVPSPPHRTRRRPRPRRRRPGTPDDRCAGRVFTDSSRGGRDSVQFFVVIPSNAVPRPTSRSADASTASASGSCGGSVHQERVPGAQDAAAGVRRQDRRTEPAGQLGDRVGRPGLHGAAADPQRRPPWRAPAPRAQPRRRPATVRGPVSASRSAAAGPRPAQRRRGRRRGCRRTPARAASSARTRRRAPPPRRRRAGSSGR